MALLLCALSACLTRKGGRGDDTDKEPTEADRQFVRDNILTRAPSRMDHVVNADLDGRITYLGCDADKLSVSPGDTFTVQHYWEVVDPPGSWKMFSHLGPTWVNVDRQPLDGKYPVSDWKAGEIVRDVQVVRVPRRWNWPTITVYVGLYKGKERMPVRSGEHDGQNRIIALTLPVRGIAAESKVLDLTARRAWRAPQIDGLLADPVWAEVPVAQTLNDSQSGTVVFPSTDVKFLWDSSFLYVGVSAVDVERTPEDVITMVFALESASDAVEIELHGDAKVTARPVELLHPLVTRNGATPAPTEIKGSVIAAVSEPQKLTGTTANALPVWTAEVAIPWTALPGDNNPAPGTFIRVRGNVLRHEVAASGKPVIASWSPLMSAPTNDLLRMAILNLADDVGALLVSGMPVLSPAPRDYPGEMHDFTKERAAP